MSFERVLRGGFVLLVGAAAVIVLLILSGMNDPKPVGALVVERPLFPQIVALEAPQLTWLEEPIPEENYSVRLTAAQEAGNSGRGMDVGYGLALGSDEAHLAVAVSPLGYLSVWQTKGQETDVILPWQTWPHVRRDLAPNEIWLDVDDSGQLTIRINRELLWAGEIEPPAGQIGVVAESFGETAVVDFLKLELFKLGK
jgi:hypothetical protein